jgi:hypothetical protein
MGSIIRASACSSRACALRCGCTAPCAPDPSQHRGDGGRLARAGLPLGAMRGGDRCHASGDRDRAQVAVGLRRQERGDRLRRGRHRRQPARDTPLREHPPVVIVGTPCCRRERRGGVSSSALQLEGLRLCALAGRRVCAESRPAPRRWRPTRTGWAAPGSDARQRSPPAAGERALLWRRGAYGARPQRSAQVPDRGRRGGGWRLGDGRPLSVNVA